MAKRSTNQARKEYQKERRRLQQIVRRGTAKGFIFPEDIIPPIVEHPTRKQVQQIKSVTPQKLYKHAKFVDFSTGEIITGKEKLEQTKRTRKVALPKPTSVGKRGKRSTSVGVILEPPITAEERHAINVQRGRKAWETRRSRMTDEEYAKYKEQFVQRMKAAREKKVHPSEPYYPTISVIDKVREAVENIDKQFGVIDTVRSDISSLKREAYPYFPVEQRKRGLLAILDETIEEYGDDIGEFEEYLLQNMDVINECLRTIRFDSGKHAGEKIQEAFGTVGKILNGGYSLSPWKAEMIHYMAEYYEEYTVQDED